ncbi:hypothetical protein TNIN_58911 [Trichonephila inaurata madagascariensis]|uniref:Uncharacterized protein n=1 Tax=Trichonephila inaurata madagascariensis TaxID=2747483 RepID=A0A8X6X6I3_9ARAC|nr:hypothetical protein TNIN_58911 [Trichonephila inaurata madagascariensis]
MSLYFEEWLRGVGVNDFEKLKDLIITEQVRKGISATTQEHFIDDWSNLLKPVELVDKLDAYENVRTKMRPSPANDGTHEPKKRFTKFF